MVVHTLKAWSIPFDAMWDSKKTFEYRANDRDYQTGDMLIINEWIPETGRYTGRIIIANISYILSEGFGIPEGYCIMSIEVTAKVSCNV